MSAKKKGRGAKVLTAPQHESEKGSSNENKDSPNLSAIERESFMEGLQQNFGNPLHSTAMEEDLNVLEEEQVDGGKAGRRKEVPPTVKKTSVKQRRAAVKRKETEKEEEEKKKSRKSTGGPSAARPVENQQRKEGKKKTSESGSGPESQEKSDSEPQSRKKVLLSSEEEEGDEDGSWCPSPKKARVNSLGRIRKSSTDTPKARKSSSGSTSASADPEETSSGKQRRKRRGVQGGTQPEVVLEAFLHFCDHYRESVESTAVKQSVDTFSSNVENQLLEKISSSKELKVLKRKNAKVGSLIRTKTQRLLDAKQELMRTERKVWLLQKERAELEVRLADLRQGRAFLQDIRELGRRYLDHRHKHHKEKETYGASSLPALLLETKHIRQLRGTDNQPKKPQKKNKTQK